MATRVAINGFGRIGRLVFRAYLEKKPEAFEIVAINDLFTPSTCAHLLKYDSVHGVLAQSVSAEDDHLNIDGKSIRLTAERDPSQLPWAEMGVDIVLECTGIFADKDKAAAHLRAGASKVVISAPASGADKTIVYGVNHTQLSADDSIISNASCTTNCLAPVVSVLHALTGLEEGYMTTIHSYTGDQQTVDTAHSDLRRARAAALNIIPTSTGAAKAIGLVIPELAGKLDGCAIRVPTANVSMVDLCFQSSADTTVENINKALRAASEGALKGVLGYNDAPLVSSDFNHDPRSSIFDGTQTQVVGNRFCRILSWYDNEWGFSNRMIDTTVHFAGV